MYGLVLEGGGAKGAYHIGAYKAIVEEGIEIKGITGTSIGAINGAMIVQGDFEKCCEIWNNIDYSMIIEGNNEEIKKLFDEKVGLGDLKILLSSFKHMISNRGVDITAFKNLLTEIIDEDKIRKSPMDFGLVTINLTDFKTVEIFKENIPQGEIMDFILASAFLPTFKAEKIGGKRYLDGGFYDNLPFKLLKEKGYKKFILVRTLAKGITRKVDLEDAIVISPSEDTGHMHQFEHDLVTRNIRLGYFDGLKALRGLKGGDYYIEPDNEEFYFNELISLSTSQIKEIQAHLKTPEVTTKRMLFEYIIPKLGGLLGLNKNFSYEDLLIGLLEVRARRAGIDRYKIYRYEELRTLVKCNPYKNDENKIIKSIFSKENTLLNIADIIFCKK